MKASIKTQASEKGLVKSVCCEYGDGMDQFSPAIATHQVARKGPYSVAWHKKEGGFSPQIKTDKKIIHIKGNMRLFLSTIR